MQHVEEEGAQPGTAAGVADAGLVVDALGAEVAHGVLEPARGALVGDAEHLAVEHEVTAGQGADHVDHAAQTIGDVVEVAGVEVHLAAGAVGLDAGAVELPLHGRGAGGGDRLGHARRPATRASAAPGGTA